MRTQTEKEMTYLTVIGLFENRANAEAGWAEALSLGCIPADLTVVMSEGSMRKHFVIPRKSKGDRVLEEAGAGGAVGVAAGAVGGVAAAIAAAGASLIVPGLGLAIAGPLAAAFMGAGAGGAVGGMLGALAGAGMPEEKAKQVENHLKSGGIVVVAHTTDQRVAAELEKEWKSRCAGVLR